MSLENIKYVLLILSGKGGVGKSSITTQLALSLSLAGHSVGVLDIDLTGPSIPRFFGIESAKVRQAPGGWLPVEVHSSQTLPPVPSPPYPSQGQPEGETSNGESFLEGSNDSPKTPAETEKHAEKIGALQAMSLAFLLASRSTAIVWRGPKKTAMIRQFLTDVRWPPLDYLLIDTPPGTSDEHISVVETLLKNVSNYNYATSERRYPALAGAVIVTTPQAVAVADVRKEINFCAKTGVKIVGVIENMSGYVCPCCGEQSNIFSKGGGQVMAHDFDIHFLGSVPIDQLWGQLVEEGTRPVYMPEETIPNESKLDADASGEAHGEASPLLNGLSRAKHPEGPQDGPSRDKTLLVDKYRSCSLFPVFKSIAKTVVEIVEEEQAVTVKSSNPI